MSYIGLYNRVNTAKTEKNNRNVTYIKVYNG